MHHLGAHPTGRGEALVQPPGKVTASDAHCVGQPVLGSLHQGQAVPNRLALSRTKVRCLRAIASLPALVYSNLSLGSS